MKKLALNSLRFRRYKPTGRRAEKSGINRWFYSKKKGFHPQSLSVTSLQLNLLPIQFVFQFMKQVNINQLIVS